MRLFLIITFSLSSFLAQSQIGFGRKFCGGMGEVDSTKYFYIYGQDTINGSIPEQNNFTGDVRQYKRYYHKIKNVVIEGKEGLHYQYGIFSELLFEGEYENGIKVGIWYYTQSNNIDIEGHKTEYKKDTVIVSPRYDPEEKKKIIYVTDSNYAYGYTTTNLEQVIKFQCYNRDKCSYFMNDIENPIFESKFEDLKLDLYKFEIGMFERDIKFLKN